MLTEENKNVMDYKKTLLGNVSITVLFLIALLCLQGLFLLIPSAIWSIGAFLLFSLFVCALAHYLPVSFILLLPYIFFRATTLISGVAIEYGGHMQDLGLTGEPTGSCIRLSAVYIIFIMFASGIIEFLRSTKPFRNIDAAYITERTQRHPWVWIFYAIFTLYSLYVLFIGFTKGFPLFEGTSRFVFLDEIGGRGFATYIGHRMIAAFLFGVIIYACRGLRRHVAIALFISMVVISILFGEKFTSLMLITIYVLTPSYFMSVKLQKRLLSHVIPFLALAALLTIPVILVIYGWNENRTAAIDRMTSRMVGQGELWYAADQNTDDIVRFDYDTVLHIVKNTISPNAAEVVKQPPYIGAHYFMYKYMPPGLLYIFITQPYLTLTFAFEPYLLENFGWLGMFVPLLFYGLVYAACLSYMTWAILNARPLSIIFAAKILTMIMVGLAQGYLYAIFGFKICAFMAAAIAYEQASRFLSRKRTGQPIPSRVTPPV